MDTVRTINICIAVVFTLCYCYQFYYLLVPFIMKDKPHNKVKLHKYAVLISARNEEAVIAQLIDSIKSQNYPSELVQIFVMADNCTDQTARVAREAGAVVWERFNNKQVGKGYALDYLLDRIKESYPSDAFDAFIVFDADNVLDENYITEMNKTFCDGYRVITSYRNSKNYGTNWISAGYSLWFLRESQYLNNSRMLLGTSCAISGTGFLVRRDVIEENNGWKFFLLTEDIEFSIHSVIKGEQIGFCRKAVLYDEQPVRFSQSWKQRTRWAKGFLQVFNKHGLELFKLIFKKRSFACYDMTMTIAPTVVLTAGSLVLNVTVALVAIYHGESLSVLVYSVWETVRNAYFILIFIGGLTVITEWKMILCSPIKKIIYIFTFPIFMFTYIPISVVAIFKQVEWQPIHHAEVKSLAEIRNGASYVKN